MLKNRVVAFLPEDLRPSQVGYVEQLAKVLSSKNERLLVYNPNYPRALALPFSSLNVREVKHVTVRPIRYFIGIGNWSISPSYLLNLTKDKVNVVISRELFSFQTLSALLFKKIHNTKLVIFQLGHQSSQTFRGRTAENQIRKTWDLNREVDYFGAETRKASRFLLSKGINPRKIRMIHSVIIDTNLFDPKNYDKKESREKYGFTPDEKLILFVGRCLPMKGVDILLKAFRIVLSQLPEARLVMVGGKAPQPYEVYSKKLEDDLHLRNKVKNLGFVAQEEIPIIYSMADVFVTPFRNQLEAEAFDRSLGINQFGLEDQLPVTLLEASSMGIPIVSRAGVGGVDEIVVDGKTGLLVKSLSEQQVADFTLKLLTDQNLANKLGRRGRQHIIKHYSVSNVVKETVRILSNLWRSVANDYL